MAPVPDASDTYLRTAESLAKTFVAPILFASFLVLLFYGLVLPQYYLYWQKGHSDTLSLKVLVACSLAVGTAQAALAFEVTYHYTIGIFGVVSAVDINIPGTAVMIILEALAGVMCQGFFTWRASRLLRSRLLAVFATLLILTQLACATYATACGLIAGRFSKFGRFQSAVIAWQVIAAFTDILLSAALVFFLQTNRSGIAETDDLITRMSLLTVQTGLLTAVWAIAAMLLFISSNVKINQLILNYPLAELYGLCLLTALNSRISWREERSNVHAQSFKVSKAPTVEVQVSTATQISEPDVEIELSPVVENDIEYDGGRVPWEDPPSASAPPSGGSSDDKEMRSSGASDERTGRWAHEPGIWSCPASSSRHVAWTKAGRVL